eukprot:PLAT11263.2.p2 GENE.PLAT11263.2~~PLAT11263.2.p2  ORF type:complete len:181 (+),score=51.41 PLAT11263.2:52-543(+)
MTVPLALPLVLVTAILAGYNYLIELKPKLAGSAPFTVLGSSTTLLSEVICPHWGWPRLLLQLLFLLFQLSVWEGALWAHRRPRMRPLARILLASFSQFVLTGTYTAASMMVEAALPSLPVVFLVLLRLQYSILDRVVFRDTFGASASKASRSKASAYVGAMAV